MDIVKKEMRERFKLSAKKFKKAFNERQKINVCGNDCYIKSVECNYIDMEVILTLVPVHKNDIYEGCYVKLKKDPVNRSLSINEKTIYRVKVVHDFGIYKAIELHGVAGGFDIELFEKVRVL